MAAYVPKPPRKKAVVRAALALQAAADAIDDLDDEDRARITLRYKNGPERWKEFLERNRDDLSDDLPWDEKELLARDLEFAKIMTTWNDVGWPALLHNINLTFALANGLLPRRLDQPPRRRGQRSEAHKNHPFKRLVMELRGAATECGGKFTFDRKNGGRGTLIAGLKLIAPCLPAGLLPNRLPYSSIERWIKDDPRKR